MSENGELKRRLRQLEEQRKETGNAACPECGFGPNDIRIIERCPIGQPEPPIPHWPAKDYCGTCGGLRPPIRIVQSAAACPAKES